MTIFWELTVCDEWVLVLILPFPHSRNLVDTRFTAILSTVAEMLLDIYQSTVGQSALVDRQLLRLQELLDKETEYQQELMEVLGMLDVLFASAHPRKEVTLPGDGANGLAQGGAGIPHRPEIQAS